MKNGNFIGQEDILPTSEEIDVMVKNFKEILNKFGVTYKRVVVEKVVTIDKEKYKYLGDYIKIHAIIFDEPASGLCRFSKNKIKDFSKITLNIYKQNGYSEYQKAVNNDNFDMFNQFSAYVRCDGRIRLFKHKNFEVIKPRNHFVYNDSIQELFDEIEAPIKSLLQIIQ